jgi:flagellar basal-body rod modification protein FlgD
MSTVTSVSPTSANPLSSSTLTTNYLNLLITQLQNQDPSDPMDNSAMTSALAQLSELQQAETMNSNFAQVLQTEQVSQAGSLIGSTINFTPSGQTTSTQATVSSVSIANGVPTLNASDAAGNKYSIPLSEITAIL